MIGPCDLVAVSADLPPWTKGRGHEDVACLGVLVNFKEHGNDDALPFPSVFRHIPSLNVFMEFVRSVEERDLNLPVRNAMARSQDVWVVDEYRSLIQQACDFLTQFAEILVANADSTTIRSMYVLRTYKGSHGGTMMRLSLTGGLSQSDGRRRASDSHHIEPTPGLEILHPSICSMGHHSVSRPAMDADTKWR